MLDRFDDRTLEIATVIIVVIIALVILCYLAIFLNPQVFFNPLKPPTEVPTDQGGALFDATWTPSPTATATNTPTSTATWTPTPLPTATPTPLPPTATDTATPTPTNTRAPTRRPPPPKPTATPTPFPYEYIIAEAGPDCQRTWVWGYVVNSDGIGEEGAQVRVGSLDGWRGDVWTDNNGYYEAIFAWEPKEGQWFVRVFKGGQPRSMQFWFKTGGGCDGPYSLQQFHIDWKHR